MPATCTRRRTWSRSGKRGSTSAGVWPRTRRSCSIGARRHRSFGCGGRARPPLCWPRSSPGHPSVQQVRYPGLATHPQHGIACRMFRDGLSGSLITVDVHGGRAGGMPFCDALGTVRIASSLGSVYSKVSHAASTTHRQLDDTALAAAGIARGRFGCRWVWRIQRICWQICVKHSTPSDVCSGPESPWAQDRLRPGKSNAECAPANSGLVGGAAEEITCRGVPTH